MLKAASLAVIAYGGLAALRISRSAESKSSFELEHKLGTRPEFAAVARYIQISAGHSSSSEETGP
jgi:hypothetical protein